MIKFLVFIVTLLLFSCKEDGEKKRSQISSKDGTTIIHTDTASLSKFIDITTYKPTQVKFKLIFADTREKDDSSIAHEPSENSLQALLYFDSITFNKLRENYFYIDYTSPNYTKSDFNFTWLEKDIREELLKSDTNYYGHPDFFLGKNGKLWLLHNKILLVKITN